MTEKDDISYLNEQLDGINKKVEQYEIDIIEGAHDVTANIREDLKELKLEKLNLKADISALKQVDTSEIEKLKIRTKVYVSKAQNWINEMLLEYKIRSNDIELIRSFMNKEQVNSSRFKINIEFASHFEEDGTISANREVKITEINNKKTKVYSIDQTNVDVWIAEVQEDFQQGFFD